MEQKPETKQRKAAQVAVIERKVGEPIVITVEDQNGIQQDILVFPKKIGNRRTRICVVIPKDTSEIPLKVYVKRFELFSDTAQGRFRDYLE